jgi:homoserine dehydrogenase
LQSHASSLSQKAGRKIEITAVSARTKNKDRPVDLSNYDWCDDPIDLAKRDDIDCVVELIGGEEGTAKTLIETALQNKKHVVTANKALLAHHGYQLAQLAENNNVALAYEAAVAGGIPVIKALREGFAGNGIKTLSGILNGTCNYILTEMRETGRDFEDVLKDAQEKGYAETPPDLDVDGVDAAHKLCLLTSLAFNVKPDFDAMAIKGIREVSATDISYADELGYKIKLLGTARCLDITGDTHFLKEKVRVPHSEKQILQVVETCLVPTSLPLAQVDDVFNAVNIEGDFVGDSLLVGRGAGAGPTASAVLSDLVDLSRGDLRPVFGVPVASLKTASWIAPDDLESRFYIRLNVTDQPGVLADIAAILRDQQISIESFLQRGRNPDQPVPIVIITHEAVKRQVKTACAEIAALSCAQDEPHILRIEDL